MVGYKNGEKLDEIDGLSVFENLSALFQTTLEDGSWSIVDSILIAIGNFGSTPEGLCFLSTTSLLEKACKFMSTATGDLKLSCLKTLSCLFDNG